jgi:dihydrofolate reductase
MKAILYMAMTINGYIAKEDHNTPWSNEEWNSFYNFIKERKNIVVGKSTYNLMKKEREFDKIGNPTVVVVTKNKIIDDQDVLFVESPKKALDILSKKGFNEIVVAGGGELNSSFLKEGLISEMYLDIEPIVFGKGIKLFSDNNLNVELELLDVKKLSKNSLQLHYRVLK